MNALTLLKILIYSTMLLLVVLLVLMFFSFNSDSELILVNERGEVQNCIYTKDITSLKYEACYDAFGKSIYFEVKNHDLLDVTTKIEVKFFDYLEQSFEINIPKFDSSSFVKLPARRNPLSIEVYLRDETKNFCNLPVDLKINYCSADLSTEQNASLKLISEVGSRDFTEVLTKNSDKFQVDVVDTESIWENICQSNWDCGGWSSCINGIQKRNCLDVSDCSIPTNIPQRVRPCGGDCVENWDCTWSRCENGFTNPSCEDLNHCGTSVNKPQRVTCQKKCIPDIECSLWSSCEATYNFLTLKNGDYSLSGEQIRTCVDSSECVEDTVEFQDCLLVVDVFTKSFSKCGKDYIGVYNKLDNKLLANIGKSDTNDIVNVDLTGESSKFYCDYCFNGILDGDEEQIDCGGSCPSCQERKVYVGYSQNFFEKVLDSMFRFMG